MLFTQIRLINDGDALDEINLNRFAYDIQSNLEELFRLIGEFNKVSGTPEVIPDTLVQRDGNGTAKFSKPTHPQHPLRQADMVGLFPKGLIVMWSGSNIDIPEGWALCNGGNGTPNLVDRFIVAAGGKYSVGNTGGYDEVVLSLAEMPRHDHPGSKTSSAGSHRHREGGAWDDASFGYWEETQGADNDSWGVRPYTDYAGSHTHGIDIAPEGNWEAHENRPPYYALAFIMKL